MAEMKSVKITFQIGPIKGETRFVMPRPGRDGVAQSAYSRKTTAEQTSPTLKAWQGLVAGAFWDVDFTETFTIDEAVSAVLNTLKNVPKVKYVKRGGRYIRTTSNETYATTIDRYFGGGAVGTELKGRAVVMLARLLHSAMRNPNVDAGTRSRIVDILRRMGVKVGGGAPAAPAAPAGGRRRR